MRETPKQRLFEDVNVHERTKLFAGVNGGVLARQIAVLEQMRAAYPSYRDDELLLRRLCDLQVQVDGASPDQPVVLDADGRARFRANAVVEVLREAAASRGFDMNELARAARRAPQQDWEQFYQLIGYSVSGYHELSRVSDAACERASVAARVATAIPEAGGCRDSGCEIHSGVEREK